MLGGILLVADVCGAQSAAAPRPVVDEQRPREQPEQPQTRGVDSPGPAVAEAESARLPGSETPCSVIDHVRLDGPSAERFRWSLSHIAGDGRRDSPIGRCLGADGIHIVAARVQQAIVERGYLTTRVIAASPDPGAGTLILTVVPGRIAGIRQDGGDAGARRLRHAIPPTPDDLLQLHDLEQGLENLKRLPTVDADIQFVPSTAADARPGDSDLVVTYSQKSPLRATVGLDDAGVRATGKTQAFATVAWDGPLGLNDLAYVGVGRDVLNPRGRGTGAQTVHYSIPFGHGLLGVAASRFDYRLTVAGADGEHVETGSTRHAEVRWSQRIHRSRSHKTTVALRGWRRANVVDEPEAGVQRYVVGGWEASLNHRRVLGEATLDGTLAHRRGTGAFGAIAAQEETPGEGTARLKLYTGDVSLNAPFQLAGQKLRYTASWRAQWHRASLAPQDRFAIGWRFTVRGFDGETALLGERGFLLRNDLGIALGQSGAELYGAVDHGQVGGASTEWLVGRHLVGGAVGVRGEFKRLRYDLFVGAPIRKPVDFRTARTTAGFSLNHSF